MSSIVLFKLTFYKHLSHCSWMTIFMETYTTLLLDYSCYIVLIFHLVFPLGGVSFLLFYFLMHRIYICIPETLLKKRLVLQLNDW